MLLLLVGLCCQLELDFPLMILHLQSRGKNISLFCLSCAVTFALIMLFYFVQLEGAPQVFMILFHCRPLPLSVGFFAQYMLKPALGVLIAKAFGMSPLFYSGFVLTSCVAGAQLSSYASFLSKGDVAVSILLTSFTTIASVLVTPLLTGLLIGSVVPVDAVAMSKSILQVMKCLNRYIFLSEHCCFLVKCKMFSWFFLLGCFCSCHCWARAQYLCKTSCHYPSTCDAFCCYDLYCHVHR